MSMRVAYARLLVRQRALAVTIHSPAGVIPRLDPRAPPASNINVTSQEPNNAEMSANFYGAP